VLLSLCPGARIVDLSHEIPPGDVPAAAWVLAQAAPLFPAGSVHLAVVDPGVGTERRPLACEIDGRRYVAPDNGLLSRVLARGREARAFVAAEPALWREPVSDVFHGRDLFAPVAAHLAGGGALADVGPEVPLEGLARDAWPEPRSEGDVRVGAIVHVDRFGNLVTNLEATPPAAGEVEVAGRRVPVGRTYADVPKGRLVALVGSSGFLEVAENGGSAAASLGASRGHVVLWRARSRS
jgi:S-adenosylmethionine hydrolase